MDKKKHIPWYVFVNVYFYDCSNNYDSMSFCGIKHDRFLFVFFYHNRLEKYRPLVLDDVVGNEEVIERFKNFAEHGNIPNFILAGPPGVGKTTVSFHILLQNLFSVSNIYNFFSFFL